MFVNPEEIYKRRIASSLLDRTSLDYVLIIHGGVAPAYQPLSLATRQLIIEDVIIDLQTDDCLLLYRKNNLKKIRKVDDCLNSGITAEEVSNITNLTDIHSCEFLIRYRKQVLSGTITPEFLMRYELYLASLNSFCATLVEDPYSYLDSQIVHDKILSYVTNCNDNLTVDNIGEHIRGALLVGGIPIDNLTINEGQLKHLSMIVTTYIYHSQPDLIDNIVKARIDGYLMAKIVKAQKYGTDASFSFLEVMRFKPSHYSRTDMLNLYNQRYERIYDFVSMKTI